MPKAAKSGRARLHDKAAKLAKAQKGQQDVSSTSDVLDQVHEGVAIASNSDVKGKKRAVESKLPQAPSNTAINTSNGSISSSHPYNLSKSSRKRMNKKARENLSLGSMAIVEDALGSILDPSTADDTTGAGMDDADEDEDESDDVMSMDGSAPGKKKRRKGKEAKKPAQGEDGVKPKIGEGKGRTLKERQRKEHLLSSRAHVQAVLQNPAFKANPFAAIREHAGNSLVMIDKQVKA